MQRIVARWPDADPMQGEMLTQLDWLDSQSHYKSCNCYQPFHFTFG